MNRFTHLQPQLREMLFKSNKARFRAMAKPWRVSYPAEEIIRRRLHRLMIRKEQPKRHNLVIVGNAYNGKSEMLRHLYEDHGIPFVNQNNEPVKPIIVSRRPENPNPEALCDAGREWFMHSGEPEESTDQRVMTLTLMLQYCHTKLLVIDGVDDYGSKELRRNRTFLTTLLRIGEDRRIPVVIVGRLSAVRLLDTIGHQADTFEVLTLPKWQDDDDFKAFLNEAESHLPLREPSHLSSLEIREPLLDASKGRLGTIDALLRACCRKAIDTRREQITPGIIEQVSRQAAEGQLEQAGSQTPEHPILDDQRY